jgi:hypothetical protein
VNIDDGWDSGFWGPGGGCGGAMPQQKTCVLFACFTNWRFSMHRVETAAKGVNNGCNSIVGINEISRPYHYPILAMSVMARDAVVVV